MSYIPSCCEFRWKRKASGAFEFAEGGQTYRTTVWFDQGVRVWKIKGFPYSWSSADGALMYYEGFYRNALTQKEGNAK